MESKVLFLAIFSVIVSSSLALTCNKAEVTAKSFTTTDATIVSQIGFITEFSLKCSNAGGENIPLFAEIEGKLTPVVRVGENKFQISWSEEIKKARSGNHQVRLFDEEGFGAVRKAQRSGENVESVKSLATFNVKHPGAFNGPYVNSEVLAAIISVGIAYVAFATKSKLVS